MRGDRGLTERILNVLRPYASNWTGTLGRGDLVIPVCDMAHEELGQMAAVHWSIPDPVPAGDPASFDAALAELSHRVERLAPRLAATS